MKMLGVVASPRKKGNTHILVSKTLDGAKAEGATTEIIFLNDLNIRECNGCHSCWKGKPCSKKDDMNKLYPIISKVVHRYGSFNLIIDPREHRERLMV
ncbi:MAG TPA: flavodoxin family protein [Anaerolineae bacterium]|nr:flavodoxin family protein [Anaerolineae bacterium]